jgi:hypothetical protein
MKKWSINKWTDKRKKDLALSIGAVSLILALPFIISFIYGLGSGGETTNWRDIGQDDIPANITYDHGEELPGIWLDELGETSACRTPHYDMVAWDPDGWDHLIMAPNITSGSPLFHFLVFTLNITVDDLIDGEINSLQANFNLSYDTTIVIWLQEKGEVGLDSGLDDSDTILYEPEKATKGNITIELNWTLLDALEWKAQNGGDAHLGIMLYRLDGPGYQIGEDVGFDIKVENPESPGNQMLILQIGISVLGVALILVATVSSPWWNPSRPEDPGILDKILRKVPFLHYQDRSRGRSSLRRSGSRKRRSKR